MRKLYKTLSNEQIEQGVIFTSTLSRCNTEQPEDYTHTVKEDTPDKVIRIRRLKDDSFFNDSPFLYNIIRQ